MNRSGRSDVPTEDEKLWTTIRVPPDAVAQLTRDAIRQLEENDEVVSFRLKQAAQHRTNYRPLFESGAIQPVVDLLSHETVPSSCLLELHEAIGIPLNTLKSWRHDLRSDPPHVPYSEPANISKRGLTPEEEETLAQRIQSEYIDKKKYLPPQHVQTMARQIHHESEQIGSGDGADIPLGEDRVIPRNDDEFVPIGGKRAHIFLASRPWRRGFLNRHGLSVRQPHAKRRPAVRREDIEGFRARIRSVLRQYPRDRIINMDETSWKLLNCGFVTIANRGSETVECLFSGDPKMCLTAIAAIDAAGGKLPIWILCRGTTARCERRYRTDQVLEKEIAQGDLVVSHQENGWTDAQVAGTYLRWLRSRFPSGPVVLLWDVFISHRCPETKTLAEQLDIRLDFIPPGATGDCQPLDRRLFGSLKSRARARFDAAWAQNHDPTMEDSIAMLLDAWRSIDQFEVLAAWETATE